MTFISDMSEAEVADVMACPVGTVKSRKFTAIARLENCLSALGMRPAYTFGG
jgi:DNA-directed RNA polymerase specialized sigma24 family protein